LRSGAETEGKHQRGAIRLHMTLLEAAKTGRRPIPARGDVSGRSKRAVPGLINARFP
jgi:hypothetical protein